jgi:hypothetical protein
VTFSRGLLALLHPDGDGRPPLNLVTLGPEAGETEICAAAEALAPDGVLCVTQSPTRRRKTVALLRAKGIEVRQALLQRRTADGSERLVSLRPEVLRRADARRFPPGLHALVRHWHPDVVLLGRRPEGRPTAEWALPEQAATEEPSVLIRMKHRAGLSATVMQLFDRRGRLIGIAKLATDEDRIVREAELLTRLGAAVRTSGAELPRGRLTRLPDGAAALLATAIEGRQADKLLGRGEIGVEAFVRRVADWLERWSAGTRQVRVIDGSWLAQMVLVPAEALATSLTGGAGHLDWMRARCAKIEGHPIPLVATHGDLTASNILLLEGARLGVLDWESARESGLPLGDLAYASVDAAWAAGGRRDRVEAFKSCFEPGGKYWASTRERVRQLQRVCGLSDDIALLSLHACWLHHAVDEGRKRAPSEPRPFLDIVNCLVQRQSLATGL